ncbi:MAG: RagB/SusD family nutrient uptake outer membrane protein, partial [Ginsengibacter sp.]
IVLRLGADFNVKSVRSTVEETYERVIKDAKGSIQYLPDLPDHSMRPSKAAAYGLLARTYLSMRQYDSAFRYADLCLQIKNTLLDYNAGSVNAGSIVPFQPFNEEIIFYTAMNIYNGIISPSRAKVDTFLYGSYHQEDLRKSAFFLPDGMYQKFKGNYNTAYSNHFFSGIASDEIYLTRAECYARLNNVPAALSDLNTLMKNRWNNSVLYTPLTATNPDEALHLILQERRKELLFRGLRWMDIKRLNKEGYNIILRRKIGDVYFTLSPNENRYALPLPTDIINLTGMQQNPQ